MVRPKDVVQRAVELPARVVQQVTGQVTGPTDRLEQAVQPLFERFDQFDREARERVRGVREQLQSQLSAAVREAVQQALQPLIQEIANLQVEVRALRADIDAVRKLTAEGGHPAAKKAAAKKTVAKKAT